MRLTTLTSIRQLLPFSQASLLAKQPNKGILQYDLKWQLAPTRWSLANHPLPRLDGSSALLDKGFFFPITHPWLSSSATYKSFVLTPRGATRRQPHHPLHQHLLWEVLEGLRAATVFPEPQILLAPAPLFNLTSSTTYGGTRHSRWGGAALMSGSKGSRKDSLHPRRQRRGLGAASSGDLHAQALPPLSPLLSPMGLSTPLSPTPGATNYPLAVPRNGMLKPGKQAPDQPSNPLVLPRRPRRWQERRNKGITHAITQVRYKPGLAKAWRLLRLQFCLAWGLPWLRQRRFTNYVTQLINVTGLNFLRMCVLSVGGLAKASGLIDTKDIGLADLTFLNGLRVTNPFLQVYKGDRITLTRNPLYTTPRYSAVARVISVPPLNMVEVDGLTRSITVCKDVSTSELRPISFSRPLPFLTFRMYNWKYRH